MVEPQARLLRRGLASEVWQVGPRFEKRYHVLWPWLPLYGVLKANLPALDARDEARNADRLRALGIEAPRVAATASRWRLSALGPVHETIVTLEPLAGVPLDRWLASPEGADGAARLAVARALGTAVARMHAAGIYHRDLYLCHVLWDGRRVALLDVARAALRSWFRDRWRAKDLAALLLSSDELPPPARPSPRERIAFLHAYFGRGVDRLLLRRVEHKAVRMARHGKKG